MKWAPSYQANVGDPGYVSTLLCNDGNTGTSERCPAGSGDRSVSAYYDLGTSPEAVGRVVIDVEYWEGLVFKIEYSPNGTSWTEYLPEGGEPGGVGGSCNLTSYNLNRNRTAAVTERYWRLSVKSVNGGSCVTNQAGIAEFILRRDSDDAIIIEPTIIEETVQARAGAKSSVADILESGGPYTWTELVTAIAAARALIFSPSPPIEYVESVTALAGAKAALTNDGQEFVHVVSSTAAAKAQQTDVYVFGHIPEVMLELVTARAAARSQLSAQPFDGVDAPSARAGGKALAVVVFDAVDQISAIAAARAAAPDLMAGLEAPVPAKAGGRAAAR
jgi:hypothetical protein